MNEQHKLPFMFPEGMLVPELPLEIPKALSIIQQFYPSAVVAGGCLRDLTWGFDIKGIDIFVDDSDQAEDRSFDIGNALDTGMPLKQMLEYTCAADEILGAEVYQRFLNHPINLIYVSRPDDITPEEFEPFIRRRMDFAACQVSFTGTVVRMTQEAERDLNSRQMTLMRAESRQGVERSLRRAERFKARMPGITFDLSIAETF